LAAVEHLDRTCPDRSRGSPPVLTITTFDDDEALAGAPRAGASGFLLVTAA
jgi:DNA-binding NarL/FixJ family response regulator